MISPLTGALAKRRFSRHAVVFIAALSVVLFVFTLASSSTKIVATSTDDAEENFNTNVMDLTNSTLRFGRLGGRRHVGMRFTGVTIPQNAVIANAYIEFEAAASDSGNFTGTFYGEDTATPATFNTTPSNISTRTQTTASVSGNGSDFGNWSNNTTEVSPDLTSIIQELNSSYDYSSGGDIAILWIYGGGSGERVADSYDGSTTDAPELVIEYTMPDDLYYVCDGQSPDALRSLDPDVGASSKLEIGSLGTSSTEGIAFDYSTNTLYGANSSQLGTINTSTGAFTNTASTFGTGGGSQGNITFSDVDGLSFDPWTGILYGTHRRSGAGNKDLLFKINSSTGAHIPDGFGTGIDYVVIDETGVYDDIDDIGINPLDGKMYTIGNQGHLTNDQLLEINKYTGEINVQGNFGVTFDMEGMGFGADGRMWGTRGTADELVEILYNGNPPTTQNPISLSPNCGDPEAVATYTNPPNTISGTVWDDLNKNTVKEGLEPGLTGVTVKLYRDVNSDGIVDGGDLLLQTTASDGSGLYSFTISAAIDVVLEIDTSTLPAGYSLTTDNVEDATFATVGNTDSGNDFGAATDTDCDSDGIPDFYEGVIDTDGDTVLDQCDLDSDNDGILDSVEGTNDTDGDGIDNYLDLDSDNDGIPDALEANSGVASSGAHTYSSATGRYTGPDTNGDGVLDGLPLSNPDTDGDGVNDYLDLDSDNDGILDVIEAGGIDSDGDGVIDGFTDTVVDGYHDPLTTTPLAVPNTDSNGSPDYIDLDADGDGIPDFREGQSTVGYSVPAFIIDTDLDGVIDAFDASAGQSPIVPVNTDGTGSPDYQDTDSEDDGVIDSIEGHDSNQDGFTDTTPLSTDVDGDGIDDAYDTDTSPSIWFDNNTAVNAPLQDTDLDGEKDWRDTDDDGDGIVTFDEDYNTNGNWADDDWDSDSTPDYLDTDPVPIPDLSGASKSDNDGDNIVAPGDTVTYTISIPNSGTGNVTGMTVTDTIDTNYGTPYNFGYTNCGTPGQGFVDPTLTFTSVDITQATTCTITYDVDVDNPVIDDDPDNETIDNSATLSPDYGAGTLTADTLTLNVTPDLSTSTKTDNDADNDVLRGQTITYTLTLINTGDGTATGVDIDDIIDSDLENLSVSSLTNCGSSYTDNSTASVLNIDGVVIDPGTNCSVVYTADVKNTATGGATIPNSVTISAASEGGSGASVSADTLTVVVPDLSTSTKTDNDADNVVAPSDTVTYTIQLNNTSGGTANGVTVTDTIDTNYGTPYNFGYTNCGIPIQGFAAPTLTFNNVTVTGSSTCTITYDVDVDNPVIDDDPDNETIDNSATVSPAHGSGTLTADTLTLDITPNLSTSTKVDDDVDNTVSPGDTITYTITITNTGDGSATGVDVDDTIDPGYGVPGGFTFSNCGSSYTNNSAANVNIDDLRIDPGTDCTVTYDVDVDNPYTDDGTLDNSALIATASEGGTGAGPLAADTLTVDTVPNLSTSTKVDSDADNTVVPGETVTYTITLINTGSGNATGVDIDDTIDSGFGVPGNFTYSNCGSSYVNNSAANVDIDDLDVAIGTNCVITYDVTVDDPYLGSGTIDNNATVSAAAEGGTGAGPLTADTLTVDTTPNISTSTKTDSDADNQVVPGETVTYTVTLINTGDGNASGIDIYDVIDFGYGTPGNFTYLNCGSSYTNSSAANLDIDDLDVIVGVNCVVTYDVDVDNPYSGDGTLDNSFLASAPSEGGSGIGPISADTINVNVTPDLSTSTKVDSDADNIVVPGETITYTITLINSGSGNGTGVDIDDTIDAGYGVPGNFTYSNCGSSYVNNSAANVDINDLDVATGTNCVVTYDVTVDNPYSGDGTLDNSFTASAADEGGSGAGPISADTLTVDVTPDLSSSTKADNDGDDIVSRGQTITYTLTLKNTGDGDATGVDIDDTMDTDLENLAVTSFTNCGSSYTDNSTANPAVLNIDNVDIAQGVDCSIQFTAEVKASALDSSLIPNTATISASAEGGSGASPSSDVLTVDVAPPDLSTSTKVENDLDDQVSPGQIITYTFTLANNGSVAGTGIDLDDTFDGNYNSISVNSLTNCGVSYTDNSVASPPVLDIDDLEVAVGTDCTILVNAYINSGAGNGSTIPNTATLSAAAEGGSGATLNADILTVVVAPTGGGGGGGGGSTPPPTEDLRPAPKELCLEYDAVRNRNFVDLDPEIWYANYFEFLKKVRLKASPDQYVLSGYASFEGGEGDAVIGPENLAVRLEVVKIALTSNCIEIYDVLPLNGKVFSDLPRQAYPDDPVMDFVTRVMYTGLDYGIIDGYAHNQAAGPFDNATRAEIFKIITNAADIHFDDIPEDAVVLFSYTDVSEDAWYYPFAFVARYFKLVLDAEFAYPDRPASRAEVSVLTTRLMFLSQTVDQEIKDIIADEFKNEEFIQEQAPLLR